MCKAKVVTDWQEKRRKRLLASSGGRWLARSCLHVPWGTSRSPRHWLVLLWAWPDRPIKGWRRRPPHSQPGAERSVVTSGTGPARPDPTRSDPAQQAGPEGGAPGGGPPGPPPNTSSNRRLQQTQAQVEEVVDIMRVNVDKVLERDQKLSELDDRADALQAGASQFESSAGKLKRKYFWKNMKMMIILGVICAIVVVAIALYFFT
ncbi:PREDICTED: vesicle-associated membrane protein 1-like [Gavialis gangeticus]|uniref:vesicle-associated membrane protein 1-like n=1 Tax=Gavialis gangeticus TaxID=94835 RepID=UPI00092F218F|nr:PREDICTED: vesicle-associated membrane protein 1-like [Gavialis gangeticus]